MVTIFVVFFSKSSHFSSLILSFNVIVFYLHQDDRLHR